MIRWAPDYFSIGIPKRPVRRGQSPLFRAHPVEDEHSTSAIEPYQLRTDDWLGPGCRWVRGERFKEEEP